MGTGAFALSAPRSRASGERAERSLACSGAPAGRATIARRAASRPTVRGRRTSGRIGLLGDEAAETTVLSWAGPARLESHDSDSRGELRLGCGERARASATLSPLAVPFPPEVPMYGRSLLVLALLSVSAPTLAARQHKLPVGPGGTLSVVQ